MSTVAISLRDIFGMASECEVIFNPLDTPYADGTALTVSGSRSVRLDALGLGTASLKPGRYSVRFSGISNNADTLSIIVPNDDAAYSLTALTGGLGTVTPPPDYLRLSSLNPAGLALLAAADTAGERTALGLGNAALLNAPTSGNAGASELVKGDDTRLSQGLSEVWSLFEKHYFPYGDEPGAGVALMAEMMASCRRVHPQFVVPPELAPLTTATHHYPLFTIMWADNNDLYCMMTPAGNPVPCIIGMATWNADLAMEGAITPNSFAMMDAYLGAGMLAGDLNGDGLCNDDDYAILNEVAAS